MLDAIPGKWNLAHITDTESQASLRQAEAMELFGRTLKSTIKQKTKLQTDILICQDKRFKAAIF